MSPLRTGNEANDVSVEKPDENRHTGSAKGESEIPLEMLEQPVTGNRFMALTRKEQTMLRRAHQNLCHPSPEQLSAALRAEVSQAVFDMKCATCASDQKP